MRRHLAHERTTSGAKTPGRSAKSWLPRRPSGGAGGPRSADDTPALGYPNDRVGSRIDSGCANERQDLASHPTGSGALRALVPRPYDIRAHSVCQASMRLCQSAPCPCHSASVWTSSPPPWPCPHRPWTDAKAARRDVPHANGDPAPPPLRSRAVPAQGRPRITSAENDPPLTALSSSEDRLMRSRGRLARRCASSNVVQVLAWETWCVVTEPPEEPRQRRRGRFLAALLQRVRVPSR
jgi:hypothetical protein